MSILYWVNRDVFRAFLNFFDHILTFRFIISKLHKIIFFYFFHDIYNHTNCGFLLIISLLMFFATIAIIIKWQIKIDGRRIKFEINILIEYNIFQYPLNLIFCPIHFTKHLFFHALKLPLLFALLLWTVVFETFVHIIRLKFPLSLTVWVRQEHSFKIRQ